MQKLQTRQPVTVFILSFSESPCKYNNLVLRRSQRWYQSIFFLFSPNRITLHFYDNPGVITIEKQSLASVILLYLRFIVQGAPGKRGNPGILGEPGEKVRGC